MERNYYLRSEIMPLVLEAGKTKSAFYRAYRSGKVTKILHEGKEVYDKDTVDRFLQGDNVPNRRGGKSQSSQDELLDNDVSPLIDVVRWEDTAPLYVMETSAFPPTRIRDVIPPTLIQSWIDRNHHVYWGAFDPHNRKDVWAVLGLLPLKEEFILKLLQGEISVKDIPDNAVLTYNRGCSYDCYIVSTTSIQDRQKAIIPLLQRALEYWRKHHIIVSRIYMNVPEIDLEEIFEHRSTLTPSHLLAKEFFFVPVHNSLKENASTHWVLQLDRFNGNADVYNYQYAIHQQRKEINAMLAPLADTITTDIAVAMKPHARKFANLAGRFRPLGPHGQITDHVRFRKAVSDADILNIIQINNALFPPASGSSADRFLPILRTWWQKNPDVFYVLEVDGSVVGFVSLLPLPQNIIDGIISNSIKMSQIKGNDILHYVPREPVNLFVWTLGIDPTIEKGLKEIYGGYLARGVWNIMIYLGERGIEIGNIYARSSDLDGINFSFGFGFEPVPPPPGVKKPIFRLDVSKPNDFLAAYKRALESYGSTDR